MTGWLIFHTINIPGLTGASYTLVDSTGEIISNGSNSFESEFENPLLLRVNFDEWSLNCELP